MRPRWRVGVVLKLVTSGLLDDLVPLLVAVVVVMLSVVMMIKRYQHSNQHQHRHWCPRQCNSKVKDQTCFTTVQRKADTGTEIIHVLKQCFDQDEMIRDHQVDLLPAQPQQVNDELYLDTCDTDAG